MRNIPVICGIAAAMAIGAELPVCEEFSGEENISCVRSDSVAVISSISSSGRSIEFFSGSRKAYLEISTDGAILASSGFRKLELATIPTDSTEYYISEVLEGILEDISFNE